MFSSSFNKPEWFDENFLKNSNLPDLGISLPASCSRINLKLYNILATPKGLWSWLYSSVVVVWRTVIMNFRTNLRTRWTLKYISEGVLFSRLSEVFICGPVYRNVGERSTAKNYVPVSLLSVVSKIFEKLINSRLVDQLKECSIFSDFRYVVSGIIDQLQTYW